ANACVRRWAGTSIVQKPWKYAAAGTTNKPSMNAPMSGQIPRTIDAEPAKSQTPDGQPARDGNGNLAASAVVIMAPRFVRWPQPDRTKKIEYRIRPRRTIAPTLALTL